MEWLEEKIKQRGKNHAFVYGDIVTTYKDIHEGILLWDDIIYFSEIPMGAVVSVECENSPILISVIIALIKNKNIIVPINTLAMNDDDAFRKISQVEYRLDLSKKEASFIHSGVKAAHDLYEKLKESKNSGLVLFSSGTTGSPKATVLNFDKIIDKYKNKEQKNNIVSFLGFDHIGGINTIFYTISSGGTVINPLDRTPSNVLESIQRWNGNILPTTPTFLNMVLMSNIIKKYDLSTLNVITYGTEPMPPATLRKLASVFPNVRLKQTYGLSEVGILPTKSKNNNELWLKIGGDGFEYKIKEDILWIRSDIAMLGYLNAESPFDKDGFFNTQDIVEYDKNREYLKILGRKSEIINVAGEKVYPLEVENIILQVMHVNDVAVFGVKNPVTGMSIKAIISCDVDTDESALKNEVISYCKKNLSQFKVPMILNFTHTTLHSSRFKKKRDLSEGIAA